jgi:hypothetical protein
VSRVDVDGRGRTGRAWRPAREAFGMRDEGCIERGLALGCDEFHAAVKDIPRREERDSGVMVVVVVPREEVREVEARLMRGLEASRIVRLALERLELRLAEGVVVRHAWSREALRDTELGEELRERVALHRRAAGGVHRHAGLDPVPAHGVGEELLRELLALLGCQHPADHVAAEGAMMTYAIRKTPFSVVASFVMSHVHT